MVKVGYHSHVTKVRKKPPNLVFFFLENVCKNNTSLKNQPFVSFFPFFFLIINWILNMGLSC